MKNFTVRLDEDTKERLSKIYPSLTFGIKRATDSYPFLRVLSLKELKGKFQSNELMALIDLENGSIFDERQACNSSLFIAELMDAFELDSLDKKHNLNRDEFINKISSLTVAQLFFLRDWSNCFWENHEEYYQEAGSLDKYIEELI